MKKKSLAGLFENFLSKESLFIDKKVLQSAYTPETVLHRDKQINLVAGALAPALRADLPSNLFIYGKTGTGKTLVVKYVTKQMEEIAQKRQTPIRIVYLNCKMKKIADTEYRLIAQITRELGRDIPATGLPTDEVYRLFYDILEAKPQLLLLVLDEIDQLVKKAGDEILYNLLRANADLKRSKISFIGVSNDLLFTDNLDPRVKSSLSEEELVFPPYNALQIQSILRQRVKRAFREGALTEGVVEKCAAYSAREHGDARRALELLRVAGELAEREDKTQVQIEHLDKAEEKIEHDRVLDVVSTHPKQFQATLYAILSVSIQNKEMIFTGEVYEVYKSLCAKVNLRPLTQRRVSDVIAELDMLGIVNVRVISKGRYGRTREIFVAVPPSTQAKMQNVLEEELGL
jgi:cell division control protein 6